MSFLSAARTQSIESPMIRQFVYLAIGIIIGAEESLQPFGNYIGVAGALLQVISMMSATLRILGYGLAALMIYAGYLLSATDQNSLTMGHEIRDCHCIGIVEQVKISPYSTRLIVRAAQCQHNEKKQTHAGVMIILRDSLTDTVLPGSVISAQGTLMPIQVSESPLDSDYPKHLLRKGIFYTMKAMNAGLKNTGEVSDQWHYRVARIRQSMLKRVNELGMDDNTTGVMKALLLGDTEDISDDILSHYAASGTIHVLAVSGMHVALIYMVIAPIFKHLFKRRRHRVWRFGIPILILWLYAGITGFSPSVIRASTMFSLMLTAAIAGRKPNGLNVLFGAGWLMCVFEATTLFDLGFQLSFSAVGGILLIEKKLRTCITIKSYILRKLWEMSSVSIAAQIGTLPVALYYFHQFPLYFLPANLIIVPLSTIILYSGIASFLLTWIGVNIEILQEINQFLLHRMNSISGYFAQLPSALLKDIYLSNGGIICLSVVTLLVVRYLLWSSQRSITIICYLLLMIEILDSIIPRKKITEPITFLCERKQIQVCTKDDIIYFHMPDDKIPKPQLEKRMKAFALKNGYSRIHITLNE